MASPARDPECDHVGVVLPAHFRGADTFSVYGGFNHICDRRVID